MGIAQQSVVPPDQFCLHTGSRKEARHLQSDRTVTIHGDLLRQRAHIEHLVTADDRFSVIGNTLRNHRACTGSDHDIFRRDTSLRDFDGMCGRQPAFTVDQVDFAALSGDRFGRSGKHRLFFVIEFRHIQRESAVEVCCPAGPNRFGSLQVHLGGDTAVMEAGAAQMCHILLHQRRLQSRPGSDNRPGIVESASEEEDIVVIIHSCSLKKRGSAARDLSVCINAAAW